MEMIVVLGMFFIFITILFITIAFYFPEWLGITGAKAKEVIESHAEHRLEDKSQDLDPKN